MVEHNPDEAGKSANRRWNLIYGAVIGFLLLQVLVYYVVTVTYQ